MRALDTHALTLFCAVARCLNFRQAAEQLHMTQPPLSRAIKTLEEKLGARLFERDTQGVALTQAGRTLLPQALHILDLLETAHTSLQRDAAPARLRLGLTSSVAAGLFRPLLAALEAQLGSVRLELTAAPSPRLVAGVRKGQLDAALLALPSATFELAVQPLARQPMMLALPAGHRLAKKRKLSLTDIAAESIYWFERARQPAFFDHCQQVFRRHGFAPAFLREAPDHHVLLGDVAAGKGMALLADSFRALRLAGVAYRPLAEGEELAAGIGLAWREEHGHAALPLLRRLAQEHLQK
ncbi:HTH-type transcriptional regulator BenM [Janthinobacterium sp. HH103]|uniref:LysR family transcriptional regulator n=1 Tax=unclassified Janthinobacterium TaxID=2610881 RepID=UPI000873EDB7|nr:MULTISPECIES: LysR family transcriptional regulator [unclassified Janthinobacterium]OEZ64757.1 HTH-type transcriptional regulator BenM [Janthinobacterium sp. HH100]OEZ77052.1 HTH-type transcriptional regulator BenM [Janthinobacterium sp. HH103]QOU75014.1 HTH-type transcriptional regulator BenM [Janthinobacterium sp. HH102]